MSVFCRGRSGWNFNSCLRATVSMSASRMVSLGLRPVLQFANFQARSGRIPDGFASAGILDQLRAR